MRPTIVITGVSSGLGQATAQRFVAGGWNVVGTVRRAEALDQAPLHSQLRTVLLDVRDADAVARLPHQALDAFGRVDALVNNAGYYQVGPLESSTSQQIRAQFDTNLFGLIDVTKAFVPTFRQQRSGVIVNISSISAENGYPFTAVYGASKAAVATLSESLNVELAPFAVSVKAIFPGTHATKIFTKVDVAPDIPDDYRPLVERFTSEQAALAGSPPESVAEVVWTAVTDGRQDKVRYYAGPDATGIPRAKRLLGQDRYFAFVKRAILNGPGPLARRLARTGSTPVEIDLALLSTPTKDLA